MFLELFGVGQMIPNKSFEVCETQDRDQAGKQPTPSRTSRVPSSSDCLLINVPVSTAPGLLSWPKHRMMGREEIGRQCGKLDPKTIL